MADNNIIVLGGAGYIGSHVVRALSAQGYSPIIVDNLSRGHAALCGAFSLEKVDILDTEKLIDVFKTYKPKAVIHLAALIEVGESVQFPERFQRNNVEGTRSVINAMEAAEIPHIVFSSTAAVYGQPEGEEPITEDLPLQPINPYGQSKVKAEEIIRSSHKISSVSLRYFNAAGANDSADIGEAHFPETHLIPLVMHAALGIRDGISIYGDDYSTKDGTCIRDYIHVSDLAHAHVLALKFLLNGGRSDFCNLGTSTGYSVREIINYVSQEADVNLKPTITSRRKGDPAFLVADNKKAQALLGWQPQRDLKDIIQSAYAWHKSELYERLYTSARDARS